MYICIYIYIYVARSWSSTAALHRDPRVAAAPAEPERDAEAELA